MKYLFGRLNKLFAVTAAAITVTSASVFAEPGRIAFNLESKHCGEMAINATEGEAVLTASADGVNAEKIKWDSDPEHLFPRMQGKNLAEGWHKGGFWEIHFSAEGKKSFKLSADMYSSGKGPRDFELSYSTDGINFLTVNNSAVKLTQSPSDKYREFSLPSELDGHKDVILRINISSDISVKGGNITGVKDGSTYINNIILSFDGENDTDKEPDEPETPDADEEKVYYKSKENYERLRKGKSTGKYIFAMPK